MTQAQIGQAVGVSGARIGQILAREGAPTRGYKPPAKDMFLCSNCGEAYRYHHKAGRPAFPDRDLCPACRRMPIQVVCDECGRLFPVARHLFYARVKLINKTNKTRRLYCTRKCHGVWLAREHGFIAHPETIILGTETRSRSRLTAALDAGLAGC